MSLFRARELWSVDLHTPDLFDSSSLLIAEFAGQSVIFVGAHDGYLRGYCPSASFNPSDLVYETLFPTPVLGLKFGSLVSGAKDKQLAVLHPRSLSVYQVQRFEDSNGTHITLRRAYQHNLNRAAFSFDVGPFGGLRGRDFLCVQSLDGQLSFFEQETETFTAQLPEILLPAPFSYISNTDSYVFVDANFYFTSYSYGSLSESERKNLTPAWTHNIGEFVLGITCIDVPKNGLNLIVLTERSLFDFNDQGKILWMKRFEVRPICSYSILNATTNTIMTLLCTEFQDLQVYDCISLKWCTKLDFIPVSIAVIPSGPLQGMLTLLSESGTLQCIYLGTMPSLYIIPPGVPEADIKVFEAEEELKRLDAQITRTDFGVNFEEDLLAVKIISVSNVNSERQCIVTVELTSHTPVNKVQVAFTVEPPLMCLESNVLVVSVCNKELVTTKIALGGSNAPISTLSVTVVVSYVLSNGTPRIIQKHTECPFDVAAIVCAGAKDAPIKLTLVTNKPTCSLNEIFPGEETTANAAGIMYLNSSRVVTIIAAKTSQRYRIQAQTAGDLTLAIDTFVKRLKLHFRRVPDFALSYSTSLPLQDFFEAIESHFKLVTKRRLKQEQLAHRATQYRTIQKKILISLKDLAPKPSTPLYTVLSDTYEMIKSCVTDLEMIELELEISRCRLNALCRLMLTLLELTTISRADMEHLRLAFACAITDGEEHGWLEIQNATLSTLLRTVLAKSSKDQNKPSDLTLEPLADASKLCKLFATAVDRATKGTNLLERSEFEEERESLPTVPSVKEWEAKEAKLVPRGSKMVDLTQIPRMSQKDISKAMIPSPISEGKQSTVGIPIETKVTIEVHQEQPQAAKLDEANAGNNSKVEKENHVKKKITEDNTNAARIDNIEEDAIWDIGLDEMTI